METYFEKLDLEQQQLITRHLQLVIRQNETMNLTRIADEDEGMLLHVEDSLSALPEFEKAPKGLYGDLGSGAGYPGIPLAIATNRKTVLIDTRAKKMEAVKGMLEELGLETSVEVFAGRAELLARKQPASFAVITARAVAQLSVLMELARPLLKKHGQLICYKAQVDEKEWEHALKVQEKVGMHLKSDRSFTLGETYQRRVIVFERSGVCHMKLPRQEGAAQRNPI